MQEAWIRWAARDAATVDNPAGWLTTVTTGEAVSGQITSIWVRLNPDKTAALKDPPPIV